MAFEDLETSRRSGAPVDLYLFRYGQLSASVYGYTNALQPITFEGVVYEPIAINRDSVKSSGTLDKAMLKITAQRDISMRSLFLYHPPSRVVTLTIRQGHLDDPDEQFLVVWAGRLIGFEREGSEAVMSCEPISTSLRRAGLRRHYQITCPHYLYGDDCKASREAATAQATVQSKSNFDVTLVTGWLSILGADLTKYRQGEFRWTLASGETEIRQILRTTAPNTLTLSGPLTGLEVGATVDVALGCNHETSAIGGSGDCTNLHNNGPNFGGFKWIPKKNPIGITNQFY